MNAKEITVTLTVSLAPADRRAINYKWLRTLYAVPQDEAAREATACTRSTAERFLKILMAEALDRITFEYLDVKKGNNP